MFPERKASKQKMPAVFKKIKNIRCIIDCTEMFCEVPRDYERQRNTWSSYKHHTTMKCLITISPTGGACFISDLFEGSIDDDKNFKESCILEYIQPGYSLLVDRGFTIQELLAQASDYFIPPFHKGRDKLTAEETLLTKRIAKARIHLERIIPLTLAPIASQLVYVACCLVNFQGCLCK